MADPSLLLKIKVEDLLSYGFPGAWISLERLNVLIGPNASGKSNLLEALAVLRAATTDLPGALRDGGGMSEYLHKGASNSTGATLQVIVANSTSAAHPVLHYFLGVWNANGRAAVSGEHIEVNPPAEDGIGEPLYRFDGMDSVIRAALGPIPTLVPTGDQFRRDQSILAQRRDPTVYPEVTYLAEQFSRIQLFPGADVGRGSAVRRPQPTDLPNEFLLPDASNLGLILHDLSQTSARRDEVSAYLRKFYENARHVTTKITGGTLQLYIEEEGGKLIPATRLSDGTLRYLCLLAILLHPNPPPVIGIEEPELGLHPDILPTIAELLRKASDRTQLFVTTHSDTLVSALSGTPECILVCESTPDGTTMKRLEAEPLREWLEKYSLGEIWRMGEIGGNRW
ncbi:AAA family ATPase [Longimicrobium sp.]|jgi:predicted ATPase|uniref:AAA family ATPase n=1 Tax=Longimicrobium sp. TaxID=2029185 RepID=UPI002F95FAB1